MAPLIDDSRLPRPLSNEIKRVLRAIFVDYRQVIVRSEFTEGYSSSRVFQVRPIQLNGPELPSVVKIDEVEAITQEWKAYKLCIQHKLPTTAVIRGKPVYPPGSRLGGLWYSLAGEGVYDVINLADYYRQATPEAIEGVLRRLLKSMDALWSQNKVHPDLHLQDTYDSFLPANLFIEVGTPPPGVEVHWLHPTSFRDRTWQVGDHVQVAGFQVVEVARNQQRLLLNTPEPPSYRLYLESVTDVEQYEIEQSLTVPITGKVVQTRMDLLESEVRQILGEDDFSTADIFTLPGGRQLPNPLISLSTILNQSFDASVACIHGDLHVKNILIEPESGNVFLIDFAKSRRDHVLRDLLHLEMSVLTDLVAQRLATTSFALKDLYAFYEQLHCAVLQPDTAHPPAHLATPFVILHQLRRAARNYLFKRGNWDEYYYGLILYLLSALKFKELSDIAKQTTFWGAAVILSLLEAPPKCQSTAPSGVPPAKRLDQISIESWQYDTKSGVAAVALSTDGETVLAGTLGKVVTCLDRSGKLRWQQEVGNQAWRAELSGDGKTAVIGTGSTRFWDVDSRGLYCFGADGAPRWHRDLKASTWGLAMATDGNTIATGTSAKQLQLFDRQGHLLWQQDVPGLGWYAWVWSAALSADGQVVAAGAADKRIRLFQRGGMLLAEHRTRADVFATAVSADGNVIAAGDGNGYVYCLDQSGNLLWEEALADKVWAVACSADGKRILVGAGEKEAHIRLYNQAGQFLWKRYVGGSITNVALSADGKRIVAGTRNGGIFIFDEDRVLHQAQAGKIVRDVVISADGERVVAGSEDNIVYGFHLPPLPP